jgi:hypothetical protein
LGRCFLSKIWILAFLWQIFQYCLLDLKAYRLKFASFGIRTRFRSWDLWVIGPPRFRHALRPNKQYWDICPKKAKIQIFFRKLRPNVYQWNANRWYKVTNSDPMIIIELWIECIKFNRHKEEFLISSQVLWRTNKKNKPYVFFYFHSMIFITMSAGYLKHFQSYTPTIRKRKLMYFKNKKID